MKGMREGWLPRLWFEHLDRWKDNYWNEEGLREAAGLGEVKGTGWAILSSRCDSWIKSVSPAVIITLFFPLQPFPTKSTYSFKRQLKGPLSSLEPSLPPRLEPDTTHPLLQRAIKALFSPPPRACLWAQGSADSHQTFHCGLPIALLGGNLAFYYHLIKISLPFD